MRFWKRKSIIAVSKSLDAIFVAFCVVKLPTAWQIARGMTGQTDFTAYRMIRPAICYNLSGRRELRKKGRSFPGPLLKGERAFSEHCLCHQRSCAICQDGRFG